MIAFTRAGTLYDETIKNGFAKLLNTQTASTGVSSMNFTSGFSGYDTFLFDIDSVRLSLDSVHFIARLSNDSGASWATTGYWWSVNSFFSNNLQVFHHYASLEQGDFYPGILQLCHAQVIGHPISGRVRLYPSPGNVCHVIWRITGFHPSLYTQVNIGGGFSSYLPYINAIYFAGNGGTMTGTIRMYGLRTGA